MTLTFQSWLGSQTQRQDRVGELARAMAEANYRTLKSKRKADEHKMWADIVTRYGEPRHVPAFNRAWDEYQSNKSQQ